MKLLFQCTCEASEWVASILASQIELAAHEYKITGPVFYARVVPAFAPNTILIVRKNSRKPTYCSGCTKNHAYFTKIVISVTDDFVNVDTSCQHVNPWIEKIIKESWIVDNYYDLPF